MATLAAIWRHPIKAHGREEMQAAELTPGQTLPGDRAWAVAHEAAKADGSAWARCANFSRGAKAPTLQAISAESLPDGRLTLRHPDRPEITFDPATEGDAFVEWTLPLVDTSRAAPERLLPAPGRGWTDSEFPSISLVSTASHAAVEKAAGQSLSPGRWRGNLIVEGLAPWQEFDLVGHEITIGTARLAVRERITRCNATRGNPETGAVDVDTLGLLDQHWGHQEFGVYAEVIHGGTITQGCEVVLP